MTPNEKQAAVINPAGPLCTECHKPRTNHRGRTHRYVPPGGAIPDKPPAKAKLAPRVKAAKTARQVHRAIAEHRAKSERVDSVLELAADIARMKSELALKIEQLEEMLA